MNGDRLFLRQQVKLLTLLTAFTLVSCAQSAPQIPDDTTATNKQRTLSLAEFSSADLAMDCTAIQVEQKANTAKITQDNEAIQSNRQQNEVAGYFGALWVVPLVATESNSVEKDDITALQQRKDTLLKLASFKNCSL